ncbi:hypothetical protein E1B28_012544 [Marasmius oreades]|uniref:PH domain-containing protein n=1 Tax=Marasmius oreades TaxID=181124 RepID=A0A9P7UQW8_9AGAR|nr:uncharacterized protein E1B28_012544 [Marasmius oreades]KAG7088564.1 hypothetical protein E1B28_012544 [Marasmius oreades]
MSPFRARSNSYQASGGSLQQEVKTLSFSRHGSHINQDTMQMTSSGSSPEKRHSPRTNLLVMASDALNFNFGRRRKSIRHPVLPPRPMPIILPDVIEISAAHKDEEVEERGRLREEAAQALGLAISPSDGTEHGSILDSLGQGLDSQDTPENTEGQEPIDDTVSVASTRTPNHQHSHTVSSIYSPLTPLTSTLSIAIPPALPRSPTQLGHGRSRSGSMPGALSSLKTTDTRSSSTAGTPPIPPFPTTVAVLSHFSQLSFTFPKYYPSSSLRIFALSKQWKTRFIVFSTPSPSNPFLPTLTSSRGPTNSPPLSYLHLFKSAVAEEKEYERLEINEDSVVFVSEEEVGGRKHVIKVGGVDVGAMRKDLSHEEGGRTMWFLQITDSAEAQKWIANIKSSILNQRAVRAGLGSHSNSPSVGVVEPRGDMDVMLSIRAQSIMTSPTSPSFERPSSPESHPPYAASISSVRSQGNGTAIGHPSGAGGVSGLKGFFSGAVNRPRSSSRATSVCSDSGQDDGRRESVVSSSGISVNHTKGGNSLMSLLRSNAVDSIHATSSVGNPGNTTSLSAPAPIPSPAQTHLFSHMTNGNLHPAEKQKLRHSQLERKIIENPGVFDDDEGAAPVFRQNVLAKRNAVSTTRAMKTMSVDAISLQPPPRKRWTTTGSHHPFMTAGFSEIPEDNGKRPKYQQQTDKLNIHGREESASLMSGINISPGGMSGFSFGTPEQRPRSPSTGSVSTIASGENGRPGSFSGERASINTKRNSVAKRWSRQLPQRLTPPSGPPPATPNSVHQRSPTGSIIKKSPNPHPYTTMERSPSRSSQSSISNGIPSFSKRASASSAFSVQTTSTSQSQGNSITSHSRPGSTHRVSLQPPPRPPPSFALPPTPDLDVGSFPSHKHRNLLSPSPPSQAQSLKDPFTSRIHRLSLGAPKPPPSGMLPPRPDESIPQVRRRAGSSGAVSLRSLTSTLNSSVLYSIPASPVSTFLPFHTNSTAPSPPPVDPLPPTPPLSLSGILTTSPQPASNSSPSRAASIKQRFRILSAPSASPYSSTPTAVLNNFASSYKPQPTVVAAPSQSPNGTPQTEKNSFIQNSGDSITALGSPITPSFPTPKIHSLPPPEPEPEITSLLPPPRRGSKRASLTSEQVFDPHLEDSRSQPTIDVDDQQILPSSLCRRGSVISLGIASM